MRRGQRASASVPPAGQVGDRSADVDGLKGRGRHELDRLLRGARRTGRDTAAWARENQESLCGGAVAAAIVLYTLVFATLSIQNYRNYGNWAFDLAIYDQAIWLVAQFDQTLMTVRGLDVWGHHVTLIAYVFAPFYWLGGGPEVLLAVQSFALGLGALPLYLIGRHRFRRAWAGAVLAGLYLMYAPLQNINSRDFHPEALCIAPFLFAWYCALRRRWGWYFVCLLIAMSTREDVALAVIMLGVVLAVTNRASPTRRQDLRMAGATVLAGIAWYAIATQVVIPAFNEGNSAFYLEMFYGRWGGSFSGILESIVRRPDLVVSDAVQPDRITFYKHLLWPVGWLALLSPVHLLMAVPQLLASVIGDSPYARTIWYQYTSVIVAPVMIATVEGAHRLWRTRFRTPWRTGVLVGALALTSYTTNIAWSPSPLAGYSNPAGFAFLRDNPRADAVDAALALIPDDAVVSASYDVAPRLAHREGIYQWPEPFVRELWGTTTPLQPDCARFPSPSVIDYVAVDLALYGAAEARSSEPAVQLLEAMVGPGGDFEVVDQDVTARSDVLVAHRIAPGPDGEPLPVNCSEDPADPRNGSPAAAFQAQLDQYGALPGATLPGG